MLKIAITGNIASGKSTVQNYIKSSGFEVLCLDSEVHKIYEENSAFKSKLIKKFGTDKRAEISKIVFKNKDHLKFLEDLIYPSVKEKMLSFFEGNKNRNFVFVGAPMLFESGFDCYFDKIILVTSNEAVRLNRLIQRNNYTKDYALLRIKSQENELKKIKKSDFIIKNEGTLEELYSEIDGVIKAINTLL